MEERGGRIDCLRLLCSGGSELGRGQRATFEIRNVGHISGSHLLADVAEFARDEETRITYRNSTARLAVFKYGA